MEINVQGWGSVGLETYQFSGIGVEVHGMGVKVSSLVSTSVGVRVTGMRKEFSGMGVRVNRMGMRIGGMGVIVNRMGTRIGGMGVRVLRMGLKLVG